MYSCSAHIQERLEVPINKAREIIEEEGIKKLIDVCMEGCVFCRKDNSGENMVNCVFSPTNNNMLFDCSLFQRYQECLMLIVDSIDYLDRFRIYVYETCISNGEKDRASAINNWLLSEIRKFNNLFSSLYNKVKNHLQNTNRTENFFTEMETIAKDSRKIRMSDDINELGDEDYPIDIEKLRLPRMYLWYTENNQAVIDAIEFLKIAPTKRLYIAATMGMVSPTPPCVPARTLIQSASDINIQLNIWAHRSRLYNLAVGTADNQLKEALCGKDDAMIYYSYSLMKQVWSNHPEYGLMPDYHLLSSFQTSGKYYIKYRDHLAHMFKVYLLGLYLYENSEEISARFIDKGFEYSNFNAIWSITALYHDIGYVFNTTDSTLDSKTVKQVCNELLSILSMPLHQLFPLTFSRIYEDDLQKEFRCFVPSSLVIDDLKSYLSVFNDFGDSVGLRRKNKPAENPIKVYYEMMATINESHPQFDHGISSASILLYMQDMLSQYIVDLHNKVVDPQKKEDEINPGFEPIQRKIADVYNKLSEMAKYTREAAKAIALHNITTKHSEAFIQNLLSAGVTIEYFNISLKEEPFAYLLRLCDELQCWDRPYASNPLGNGLCLRGEKIRMTDTEGNFRFCIHDANERDRITKALTGIIDPPIDSWLDNA